MKLPFDFGVQLFFRLVAPGFLAALGFSPVVASIHNSLGLSEYQELGLAISTLACGWAMIIADMPVYMLLEGRRYWPAWLRNVLVGFEHRRLTRILRLVAIRETNRPAYLEASVEQRQFPLNQGGEPYAPWPTRLGNAVAAFEGYPFDRYGLDAVFFWPRIWLHLPKDTREVLDASQALADGAVYGCISLYLAAVLWAIYAGLSAAGVSAIPNLPSALACASVAVAFAGIGYGVYRAAVFTNAQFGELFKATFDLSANRFSDSSDAILNINKLVSELSSDVEEPALISASTKNNRRTAWRYLHNYRIKCPTCAASIPAPAFSEHRRSEHRGTNVPRPLDTSAPSAQPPVTARLP